MNSIPYKNFPSVPLLALALFTAPAQGAILIQELFDNANLDATLDGQAGTASSVGLAGTWTSNGNTTTIVTANNFNVNGNTLPGLPSQSANQGGIYRGGATNYGTNLYATIGLAAPVSFATSGTLYFSVRLNNTGDTSMGVGLSNGSIASSEFIGAGLTWNTATNLSAVNASNAAYVTYGTLGQDLTGNNDGVYAIRASEAAGNVNGYALLVGRITINAAGNDILDLKRYAENSTIDPSPTGVSWSASTSFDSSMNATQLLLWMNGGSTGELDAIRFGQTWMDVTGVPEPTAAVFGMLGILGLLRRRR